MKLNREQALFLVTLLVCGLLAAMRASDAYRPQRTPRSKRIEDPAAIVVPEVRFPGAEDPSYDRTGRDFFLPPRDWNPLPPLALEWPPLPPLDLVEFVPAPGLEPAHLSLLRRSPRRAAADSALPAAGESEGGEAVSPGATPSEGDARFAGIDFEGGDDVGGATEPTREADLLKRFDWIQRRGMARVWGRIVASDPFELLDDPGAPIRFQAVDVETGRPLGTSEVPRGDLEGAGRFGVGFGFADTVANRVRLLEREVGASSQNVRSQVAAAERCLEWVGEDRDAAIAGARSFLERVIPVSPKEVRAWELLARAAREDHDVEREMEVLDAAQAAGVESPALAAARARLLADLGLADEGIDVLTTAVKRFPNAAELELDLGRLLVSAGRGEEALVHLAAAESRAQTPAERLAARLELATAQFRTARLEEARASAERALRVGIDSARAHVLLGALSLVRDDIDGARGSFERALEVDPDHRDAVFDLGIVLVLQGGEGQARSLFERAADLDPMTWFETAAALGALEERAGNLERARDRFEEALSYDPERPYGLYRLGRAARRLGDVDGAREALRAALEREGRFTPVLDELGYTELLADRPKEAALYLTEALRREPGHRAAHVLLGMALLRRGQLQEARTEFERGLGPEENPDAAALCGLAWCSYREGRVDDALRRFAEAHAAAPAADDPFAVYADRNQQRIDDHRAKEQWIDRFDRRQIKNGWVVREPYGPTVRAVGDGLVLEGMQRRTDPDQPTEVLRPVSGRSFVSVEADCTVDARNDAAVGLRFVFERVSGRETIPHGEVAAARFPDGTLRVFVREDKNTVTRDWEPLAGVTVPADRPFTLAIERSDYEHGAFRVYLDGRVVADDLRSRSLRKLKRQCLVGLVAFAGANRNVSVRCDRVRLVRYRE